MIREILRFLGEPKKYQPRIVIPSLLLISALPLGGGIKDIKNTDLISSMPDKPAGAQTLVIEQGYDNSYQAQWGCQPNGLHCSPVYDNQGNPIGAYCVPAPQCEALYSPDNPLNPYFNPQPVYPQPSYDSSPQESHPSTESDQLLAIALNAQITTVCCLLAFLIFFIFFISQRVRSDVMDTIQPALDEFARISDKIINRD